jgi:phenylalanyl-tRNA synthetase beta chain
MKVPLSWLKEFVDIPMPVDDLAHRLTMAGLEVAEVIFVGLEGAELPWDRDKILVANVLEVREHPNADRLVLADVDYGADEPHTVVTGAPNLFPHKGQGRLSHPLKSVFAREGAQLYDGHQPGKVKTTLKGRPVRGVMSDAMLCSEKELGLSEEHEGILFLEDDAPVGTPLCDFLGEVVLDIDLTPNLARCLSIVGVAREVAAMTGARLHIPDPQVQMDGPPIEKLARVTVDEPELCPRFTLAVVDGITIKPSPPWMQRRLHHAGMRPINNIVDISNYVMLEWGAPSHAFDADRVQNSHLIARLARPDETLITLDGRTRNLAPPNASYAPPLLVCDPAGPLAIAGVMGGEESEVRETTTRVLLEAAIWEPRQIRRTAQAFKIPSEASRRYERGVDIEIAAVAQRRALELMRTLAGGTVAKGLLDVFSQPWQAITLELSPIEVMRIVGIHLNAHDIANMLAALGFECEVQGSAGVGDMAGYTTGMGVDPFVVRVRVPSFRQDVTCLADLCEEVARIYGYDHIPSTQMFDELPVSDAHPELELEQRVRDMLVGCGLNDVITYALTSMETVAKVNPTEAAPGHYLKVSNAVSPERQYLQRSLLPNLLESLSTNLRERERALLFEIGRVFWPREGMEDGAVRSDEDWLPYEPRMVGMVMAGPRVALGWQREQQIPPPVLDFFDIKGVVETLLERLELDEMVSFVPLTDDERFHPGRAASVVIRPTGKQDDPQALGVVGELHPVVCERLELEAPRVMAAELNLDLLVDLVRPPVYASISRYPSTVQDLAVVVDEAVSSDQVAATIRRSAGDLLETLTLFDVYSGAQIGAGKRSLAYRLTFRAPDRTLSDEALAKVRAKIVKALERTLNAAIRGG